MCEHSPPIPSLPSPVSSYLCAEQVFQKTLVQKQSATMGGAPTCRHTQQKKVSPRLPF